MSPIPVELDGPDADSNPRHVWLARMLRLGAATYNELVTLVALGDPAAASNLPGPTHERLRAWLAELETQQCIKDLYDVKPHGLERGQRFVPNYRNEALLQLVSRCWPLCPACLSRGAYASRKPHGLELRCLVCGNQESVAVFEDAARARDLARKPVLGPPRRNGSRGRNQGESDAPQNMSRELHEWLKNRPRAEVKP